MSSPSPRLKVIISVVWVTLLIGYVLGGTPETPFHGDESTQIYMSRDYAYQFINHDWTQLVYSENPVSPTEQQLRLLNGTVNKYLIGVAWHLRGMSINNINEQWDWAADWNYNQTYGHAPGQELLLLARWPSVVLLAAGVVIMFSLGRALGGIWTPFFASLYCALNPALLLNGRRAMMEGSFIFFSLLVLLVGIWLLKQPSLRHGILLGLVSGFALASKHTAIFTVGVVFVGVLFYLIYQSLQSEDDNSVVDYVLLPYLGIAALITFGVFFVLNPAWWGDPAERARTVLQLRQNLLNGQAASFGGYNTFGDQLGGLIRQGLIVFPQYFEVAGWEGYIGDQILRYESSLLRGVSIGGSFIGALVLCGIMAIGIWNFVRPLMLLILRRPLIENGEYGADRLPSRTPATGTYWLIGLWMITMFASTLILTPLEWQRYYLPLYPAIGLLVAVGLDSFIRFVGFYWRISRSSKDAPLVGNEPRPDTLPELT